ncbi:PaaI family thioesterase [Pontibacter qinzhouensis]|uniref:PaaI family thioesterase n=1 Tax=Pontibacter qinzhouensis TaxID=2603253 RepID=A0A5C8K887_9BACT|nr:PaaI family thioesterase [Pontibacter qinzhouensis]TXK49261.1 PaaI family thioesterase [Pontibacter qinzhouensis]
MTQEEHYKQLEKLFLAANIQEFYTGSTIQVSRERAKILLPTDPKFFHGANAVHGSVYFKLLDDAAWFAAASVVRDFFIVTSSFQMNLLRMVNSGHLSAVGMVRSVSRQVLLAESVIYNERGKEVAFGTGQFMRTNQPLAALEGYSL